MQGVDSWPFTELNEVNEESDEYTKTISRNKLIVCLDAFIKRFLFTILAISE